MSLFYSTSRGTEFGLCSNFVEVPIENDFHEETINCEYSKTLFVYGDPEESEVCFIYDKDHTEKLATLEKFTEEKPWNDLYFLRPQGSFIANYPKTCKFTCVWFLNPQFEYEYKIHSLKKDETLNIGGLFIGKTYLLFNGSASVDDKEMKSETFYRKSNRNLQTIKINSDKAFIAEIYRNDKKSDRV